MIPEDTPVGQVMFAALDFESSGASPGGTDEPVQVGMAVMHGTGLDAGSLYRSLLRSTARVTRSARLVHGIADEHLEDAPEMRALWPEFQRRLAGAVVVAHGGGTERRFLRQFPFHGFGPWLDTLPLSRALLPGLADHALSSVVGALDLEGEVREACPDCSWHDALFDAVACLVFLRHVIVALKLEPEPLGRLLTPDTSAYHRERGLRRVRRELGLE